ncbi:hypothetical protein [Streptomyces triticiradicis]|uniref:Lipoprotein n=1 Tax=Streptomyces triticiradicis TaxID=2651189 RepID=A0A7J5DJT6_9ACTN|nr:hypothetical protein [Streptomyces triticiradicis]KAB1988926.1 hypothetical protein F8144_10310 [Streptomyces triticiradicis]
MKRASATRAGLTAVVALAILTVGGCRTEEEGLPAASPSGRASGSPAGRASGSPAGHASESVSPKPTTEPSGPRTLEDAPTAGGLDKLTGGRALTDVPVDPGEMRDGMKLVTGNYGDADGKGAPVLFEGVDHVPEDTNKRREHLFRGMLEHIQWDPELGNPQAEPVEAGPLGGSVECLLASLSEDGNVICGWADEGTAAVALFENSTLADAGKLFVAMRADLEH